jgi:glycosyltransferase involved in cell wall biosynthesis
MSLKHVRISIIIPVLNEASTIGPLLEAPQDYGADELLVADGGSVDQTAEIASRHARVVHADTGRAIQMNTAAAVASGDILLFLHADTRLGAAALNVVRSVMEDDAIIDGNFDIRYEGKDWAAETFTHINRWRRRFGVFYGDSGIFCRHSVFQSLGGFVCWPILEDYEFGRRLRQAGNWRTSTSLSGFPTGIGATAAYSQRWQAGFSFKRYTLRGYRQNIWPASIGPSDEVRATKRLPVLHRRGALAQLRSGSSNSAAEVQKGVPGFVAA